MNNFGINIGAMANAMARSHYRPRQNPIFGDDHIDLMFFNLTSLGIRRALEDEINQNGRFISYADLIMSPPDGHLFLTGMGNELVRNVFRVMWYQTIQIYTTRADANSILPEGAVPQIQLNIQPLQQWFEMARTATYQQLCSLWFADSTDERPNFVPEAEWDITVTAKAFNTLLREAYQFDNVFKYNVTAEYMFRKEQGANAEQACTTLSVDSFPDLPEVLPMPIGETDNLYPDIRDAVDADFIAEQASLEQAAKARRLLEAQGQDHLYPADHFRLDNPVAAAKVAESNQEQEEMTEQELDDLQEDVTVIGLDPDYDVQEADAEIKQQAFESWLTSPQGIAYQEALLRGEDVLPPTFSTHAPEIVEVANGPVIHIPAGEEVVVSGVVQEPAVQQAPAQQMVHVQLVDEVGFSPMLIGGQKLAAPAAAPEKSEALIAKKEDPNILGGSFGGDHSVPLSELEPVLKKAEEIEQAVSDGGQSLSPVTRTYFLNALARVTGKATAR